MLGIVQRFDSILVDLTQACHAHYGERLVSLAVFGSVGRGVPRADSDVDCLIVADDLPRGRVNRVAEFGPVETDVIASHRQAHPTADVPLLSPIIKTPAEVEHGSLLFLDMTEDARMLFDRDGFLADALERFKARLDRLGARRIWRGSAWYWDLKPDFRPGDVFEL